LSSSNKTYAHSLSTAKASYSFITVYPAPYFGTLQLAAKSYGAILVSHNSDMPLQKSFSEQNGSSRNRQLWQRSKSHSAVNPQRTSYKRPLEPVSEASKNKLQAFQFQPPVEQDDSEKAPTVENASQEPEKRASSASNDAGIITATKAAITPISRLQWQDLVGPSEANEEEEDISPNERIMWETKRDGPYGLSPMIPRKRGKKRARSSSPTSSPAGNSKPTTPAVNVRKLTQALKSSHADPALELWDRFSLSGSAIVTPHGATNPALAQIMVSSSPQPSKLLAAGARTTGTPTESSLRRAISCGANWPKRRRVERAEPIAHLDVVLDESPSEGSKSSMVNALLRSVTGEINRSKAVQTRHDALRSPSPRKNSQRLDELGYSPRRKPSPQKPPPPLFNSPSKIKARKDVNISVPGPEKSEECLSDYGDDDFDDDTLMVLDASLAPACEESHLEIPVTDTGPKIEPQPAPLAEGLKSDDDEFGDMDDDIFAAAEDLMAEIDSSRTSHGKSGSNAESPAIEHLPLLAGQVQEAGDDAYEDDFGVDFDFEAAEIAATQTAKHMSGVSGSLPSVCR
jgi:hypothetical protein